MKILKKLVKIIFYIITYFLIIILALYLLLVLYQKFFSKSDLISFKNYYIFQIASSSMETDLHIGDYIIVLKTDDYQVGDIITFKEDGIYITHRVYEIKDDEIITKGDANKTVDESINKNDILGKVLCKFWILTYVVKYRFLIITIILVLFVLENVFKSEKEVKEVK